MNDDTILVSATYGLGATCVAELPEAAVREMPVRQLLREVAEQPQASPAARRSAAIFREIGKNHRAVDVERRFGPSSDDGEAGEPIDIDDKALANPPGTGSETKQLQILVSEPFVGG